MVKTLNIFFYSTKKALRLKLGIQHRGLKVYQVCSNDEARMIFDLCVVWSKLCPSCCGNTGRMLHGICKYAIAVFVRLANCGPWAFVLFSHVRLILTTSCKEGRVTRVLSTFTVKSSPLDFASRFYGGNCFCHGPDPTLWNRQMGLDQGLFLVPLCFLFYFLSASRCLI